MPPRRLIRAFAILWIVTGVALLTASLNTVWSAVVGSSSHHFHVVALATIESIAAMLFLVPRSMGLGAIGLLFTIGIAFTLHALSGDLRSDLALYAASVVFVAVHGPLSNAHWKVVFARR